MGAASGLVPGTTLRAWVLALVVAFGLSAASGEEGGALRIAGVAHDPAGSVTVTLLGWGASELPAGSVSASLGGVELGPATVTEDIDRPTDRSLVLAFETSSSMRLGRLERAQQAALVMLDGLEASDRVAVVAFGDEARVVLDFTSDRAETRSAIESLTPGSNARIYAGVETAAELLEAAGAGGKALVLFGWGWEFGGGASAGRVESAMAAKESGAAIFWVPLGLDFDAAYFDDLTSSTGGRQLTAAEAGSLAEELATTVFDSGAFVFQAPVLPAGRHPLLVTTGGVTMATTLDVSNDGLLRVGGSQAGPAEPLVISVDSAAPLSSLEIDARSGGEPLPVEADGRAVRLDPWEFAPGALDVRVTARVGGEVAATETISLQIASLEPELVVEPVEVDGARAVEVSWRAQGAASAGGATLLVSIDGEAVLRTEERGATVPAPGGGAVEASLESADGATLIRWAGEIEGVGGVRSGPAAGISRLLAVVVGATLVILLLARGARGLMRRSGVDAVTMPEERDEPDEPPADVGPVDERPLMLATPLSAAIGDAGRELKEAVETWRPRGAVVVRNPDGGEIRVPIRSGQVSVGTSQMCDVTLVGGDVRPVHVILAATSDFTHRVLPLGRVSLVESGDVLEDGSLITVRQWLALGDHLVCIESW